MPICYTNYLSQLESLSKLIKGTNFGKNNYYTTSLHIDVFLTVYTNLLTHGPMV